MHRSIIFSNTPHLLKTFLPRRASLCSVIISDRSALEISSRGSSKLTSEFSASEIFVQMPGSSVTSLRRQQSGGDSALPPPIAPAKMTFVGEQWLQPHAWPLVSLWHCSCLSVRAGNNSAGWPWSLWPNHKHTKGERVTWIGLSRTSSPLGTPSCSGG